MYGSRCEWCHDFDCPGCHDVEAIPLSEDPDDGEDCVPQDTNTDAWAHLDAVQAAKEKRHG
jgi:hypothetical protein